jgi:hypothetical protein
VTLTSVAPTAILASSERRDIELMRPSPSKRAVA